MDCLVSVFVPDSMHATGTASYQLSDRTTAFDPTVVTQAGHHGDWVGTRPGGLPI